MLRGFFVFNSAQLAVLDYFSSSPQRCSALRLNLRLAQDRLAAFSQRRKFLCISSIFPPPFCIPAVPLLIIN